MPMSLISELYEYWREFPPSHILLRDFVGYKAPERVEVKTNKPVIFNASPKSVSGAGKREREIFESLKKSA